MDHLLIGTVINPDLKKTYTRHVYNSYSIGLGGYSVKGYEDDTLYFYDNKLVYGYFPGYNNITDWIHKHLIEPCDVYLENGGIPSPSYYHPEYRAVTLNVHVGAWMTHSTIYIDKDDRIAKIVVSWQLECCKDRALSIADLHDLTHRFKGQLYKVDKMVDVRTNILYGGDNGG